VPSERRVRQATLGDDLSNAVVRHGDSLLGEGGESRNQTNHAVDEARVVLHVRFPARWSSSAEVSPSTRMLCTAPWAILRVSAVSALCSTAESRRSVCGRWPSRGPMALRLPQCWTTLWFSIRHRSNRTAVGPSSSVISEWLTTYSPSSSRLPTRATRRDCSRDCPVRDATLIVPAGDSDGIKPRDRRR
jgi:hypothetical protein